MQHLALLLGSGPSDIEVTSASPLEMIYECVPAFRAVMLHVVGTTYLFSISSRELDLLDLGYKVSSYPGRLVV